jgi:hypothetical protein
MEPGIEVRGRFADEVVAREAADALNRWFRWIVEGSALPAPEIVEPLGVDTADWAWALGEDVDWTLGPHARATDAEVTIELETHETHTRLIGLLRGLGALTARAVRAEPGEHDEE